MYAEWLTATLASSNWDDGIILGLLGGRKEISNYGCLRDCVLLWGKGKWGAGRRKKERADRGQILIWIHSPNRGPFLGQVHDSFQVQWPVPSLAWEHLRKEERSFLNFSIDIFIFFSIYKSNTTEMILCTSECIIFEGTRCPFAP